MRYRRCVKAPLIAESPLNIECQVVEVKELGSHDMFIANVVAVNGDTKFYDPSTGQFQLNQADLIAYSHGKYYTLGEKIGGFGFSVDKRRNKSHVETHGRVSNQKSAKK